MSNWCWRYWNKYGNPPGKDIEGIFFNKVKNGLDEEIAQEIENELLPSLSDEADRDEINVDFLYEETIAYFNERKLEILQENILVLLDKGKPAEAKKLVEDTKFIEKTESEDLDLGSGEALKKLDESFDANENFVVRFPRQLGDFWNTQMVRGNFIGILAPEKRGKTFLLIEIAIRAARQGSKVAFFQAGDMTEKQFLRRIAIYLSQRNTLEKYCGKMYEPLRDCVHHQLGQCQNPNRQCDFGPFEGTSIKFLREEVTRDQLAEALKDNPDYQPCHNCDDYWTHSWGAVWLKEIDLGGDVLDRREAKRVWHKFFIKHRRYFKLKTYANGTLTIKEIERVFDVWKKMGFEPELTCVDYAELLDDPTSEYRHKQNNIWKGFRRISQERNTLVITPTQADAESYTKTTISTKNFSEDKRKYGHVTGFYGLNQDPDGREKKIGILRINALLAREEAFEVMECIHVLQNLRRGRPFLESYW